MAAEGRRGPVQSNHVATPSPSGRVAQRATQSYWAGVGISMPPARSSSSTLQKVGVSLY